MRNGHFQSNGWRQNREPGLEDLIADPLVVSRAAADGLTPDDLRRLVARWRRPAVTLRAPVEMRLISN